MIRAQSLSIRFGERALLDEASFAIERGERVALLGRNGEGKTTLMRILAGEIEPDSGELVVNSGTRVARLVQDVPARLEGTVLTLAEQAGGDARGEAERIEARPRLLASLSRLQLDADAPIQGLSGGQLRRVLLARALADEPDLLLLDEPTNHLDIGSIEWLEAELRRLPAAIMVITHDRRFMQAFAERFLELDRGQVIDRRGRWDDVQRAREAELEAEARADAEFDRKLAAEEAWIRQGIKARRTRNEGRVRALKALREKRVQRRNRQGQARVSVQSSAPSGKRVFEAQAVSVRFETHTVLRPFDLIIQRGDRIGIVGPNGAGKSTLIRTLLGDIEPSSGKIERGTRLDVAWFDQLGSALVPGRTVIDQLDGGREQLEINGKPRHAISYLQDFLFSPQRARSPVESLSGGERQRLLLAKLFMQPSNLLVLDEPSNDLDLETLELLEQKLLEYAGTVLLSSHDRSLLENTVESILWLPGDGNVFEYVGGWQDAARQHAERVANARQTVPLSKSGEEPSRQRKQAKLAYLEQRELDALPEEIDQLEQQQAALEARVGAPQFYSDNDAETVQESLQRLETLSAELQRRYERWGELEDKVAALASSD